jgi:hypothetical protein
MTPPRRIPPSSDRCKLAGVQRPDSDSRRLVGTSWQTRMQHTSGMGGYINGLAVVIGHPVGFGHIGTRRPRWARSACLRATARVIPGPGLSP